MDWGKVLDQFVPLPPVARALILPNNLQRGLLLLQSHRAGLALIAVALLLLVLAVLRAAIAIGKYIYTYFIRPGNMLQQYGSWAVVTGCGCCHCPLLPLRRLRPPVSAITVDEILVDFEAGLNLVLVSRTESKLAAMEEELRSKHSVKLKHCAVDLCQATDADYARLAEVLEGVDVGVLVNNAGMSYDHPDYLETIDDDLLRDIITINTLAPTRLSKLVLTGMKERRRGVIVNVGSGISTVVPSGPLLAVYTATKAYIEAFSQSLDAEVREYGVRVQNQAPMFVATKMAKIRRARLDAPTPQAWAKAAVAQIGQETSLSPYWFHGLQIAGVRLLPSWVIAGQVMRIHKGMQRAWYRKQARLAAQGAASALQEAGEGEEGASQEAKKGN
ncbi:hypothetical protein N2152v2_004870 [Parachlorella kessleri]